MDRQQMGSDTIPARLITVLIAIYKAGKFIEAKINNIKQQTIFDQCTIVLLNCQNLDDEKSKYNQFLQENENVIELFYPEYIRLYPTWNDGIKAAPSEFVCNSNADDMLHPEYLEKCTNYLRKNNEIACVSSNILLTYTPNQSDHTTWQHEHTFPDGIYPSTTAGPCPVWRRSLHEKYGYFGNYRTIGDAKMWEKWHAGKERFAHINRDLVLYYASGLSLERRTDIELQKSFRDLDLEDEAATRDATTNTITAQTKNGADSP